MSNRQPISTFLGIAAAVVLVSSSYAAIINVCSFSGNTALLAGGGTMHGVSGTPTVTNCKFEGNTAALNSSGSPRLQADGAEGDALLPCPSDINGDGVVNVLDLINLLLCFGQFAVPGCESEDVNDDGVVNVLDLITLLLDFGLPCE